MADASISGNFIIVLNDNLTNEEINAVIMNYRDEIQVKHVYDFGSFKGFAGKVTQNGIERLKLDPRVKYIENDGEMSICGKNNSST